MKSNFAKAALCGATCLSSALSLAPLAMAQQATTPGNTPPECLDATGADICAPKTASSDIVVTGTRIRRSAFDSPEPITVISRDEMTAAGFSTATEALQSTAITQGASQINNYYGGFVTDGGTGANTLGLRGLGPTRTLVLLNGRRLAPAGTRGSVGSVDTNVLPSALIDRIEVLKAGASSIYGSDAVAGVVNIITDKTLKGLVLDAEVKVPEVGAGTSERISASFGIDKDRFTVIGSLEFYRRTSLARNQRAFTRCPIAGFLAGEGTNLGDGDYIDPKTGKPACFSLNNGGVTINTLGVPTRKAQDRLTGTIGNYNRLVPDSSVIGGPTPGYSGVTADTRDTFDPTQEQEQLVTPAKIYTGFVQATYDTNALGNGQIYVELLANRRDSSALLYRQLTLDYAQGSPLLPEIFRDGSFLNPTTISNGSIVAARSFIGYGLTNSEQRVDFARAAGGFRGDLAAGWRYDLYGSYSWTDSTYDSESFLTDRLAQSLDVVQNADGTFSCVNPANGCVAAPAVNAASIGGNLSDAYRNFIVQNVTGTTKFKEYIGSVNLDGPLFTLPGGKAQASIGAEYRHSAINDQPPPDSVNDNLYNLTSAAPTVGADEVWEVFGEVDLPLLAKLPFIYSLDLSASGRYTHYRSYGGGWTYKLGAQYDLVKGIGFRGSYGTSYRAPALFEQFLGGTTGFLSSSSDPCDNYAASTNPNIQKNCAAIGLPTDFTQVNGVTVVTGGGASSGLKAETSDNLSLGIVLKPDLPASFGKFSASLDYFAIEVKNGVANAGAENILNFCYNDASFDATASFCRLVSRDNASAVTVYNDYVNLSTYKVKGYELDVRYSVDIGPGNLLLDALVNKYTEQASRLFSTDALIDTNGTIGVPDWTGTFEASYRVGAFKIRYGLDWTGGDSSRTYDYIATDTSTGVIDPDTLQYLKENYKLTVRDYFVHALSVQYTADTFELTVGARNVLNAKLPQITATIYDVIGNTPLYSGYDYVGRTFFVNVTTKFK